VPPCHSTGTLPVPCSSSSHSVSVYSASGLSLSKYPEPAYICQYQDPTLKSGCRSAPSFSDFDRSRKASRSSVVIRPMPSQRGHMPCGSLKENAFEYPTYGSPARENSSRSSGAMSVIVPTVERELPAMRFWSTTIAAEMFSIVSTSGCP